MLILARPSKSALPVNVLRLASLPSMNRTETGTLVSWARPSPKVLMMTSGKLELKSSNSGLSRTYVWETGGPAGAPVSKALARTSVGLVRFHPAEETVGSAARPAAPNQKRIIAGGLPLNSTDKAVV